MAGLYEMKVTQTDPFQKQWDVAVTGLKKAFDEEPALFKSKYPETNLVNMQSMAQIKCGPPTSMSDHCLGMWRH